jgi:hypothetical protein
MSDRQCVSGTSESGFAVITILSFLVGFGGCGPSSQQDPQAYLLEELQQSAAESSPIESHEQLAESLSIPMSRVEAIVIGPQAQGFLTEKLAAGRLDYICIGDACICAGDSDCNDMFSGVCRDPRTNGACTEDIGGTVICYCTP